MLWTIADCCLDEHLWLSINNRNTGTYRRNQRQQDLGLVRNALQVRAQVAGDSSLYEMNIPPDSGFPFPGLVVQPWRDFMENEYTKMQVENSQLKNDVEVHTMCIFVSACFSLEAFSIHITFSMMDMCSRSTRMSLGFEQECWL